jgi:hypothetical protein
MVLSASDVERIASEAAQTTSSSLAVSGVTFSGGGSGYSEVLITVRGCRTPPCQIALGVFRDISETALREEIATSLRRHLQEHPAA